MSRKRGMRRRKGAISTKAVDRRSSVSSTEILPEILRGVALSKILRPSLWSVMPADMKPVQRRSLSDLSGCCSRLDCFLSHTWSTPGRQKYLVLLLRHYWKPVAGLLSMLVLAVSALDALGFAPTFQTFEMSFAGRSGRAQMSPLLNVVPLAVLPMLFVWPMCVSAKGQPVVFFDAICIDQGDEDLKALGIASLSGFLANSDELVILWTPKYFSRAWCVYELALFSMVQPGGKITFLPLFSIQVVFFAMLFQCLLGTLLTFAFESSLNATLHSPAFWAVPVLWAVAPAAMLTHHLRPFLAEKKALHAQLATFDIGKAQCRDADDHDFILESVRYWHGSEANFNSYVHTEISARVRSLMPSRGLSYKDVVLMSSPMLLHFACILIACARAGMPRPDRALIVTSTLSDCFFGFPLAFRFYTVLAESFAERRRSSTADAAMTGLLALCLLFLQLLALGTGGSALEAGNVSRIVATCLAKAAIAVVVFRKEWLGRKGGMKAAPAETEQAELVVETLVRKATSDK